MLPSSSKPYTFTPVSGDLVRLSAEIEALSGRSLVGKDTLSPSSQGHAHQDVNALVGVSHVACRICGRRNEVEGEKEEEVVALKGHRGVGGVGKTAEADVVAIRDPRAPSTATVEDAVRRYKVTRAFSPWTSQEKVYEEQGRHVTDWIWRGFNATLVSFGQQGTGKSYTLFNDSTSLSFPHDRVSGSGANGVDESCGMLVRILEDLFARIDKDQREGDDPRQRYKVGLSCWEILGNKTVDLLKPFSAYGNPGRDSVDKKRPDRESHLDLDYVTVGVGSLSEVRASLNHARASSTNWYVDPSTRSLRLLPNRSHAFVRVVIFDNVRRTMAHLHVVDLCGSQSLANARKSPSISMSDSRGIVPRDMLSEHERERKGVNQQLLAFSRLVGEIAQQSDDREFTGSTGAGVGQATVGSVQLSARDTKLTRDLAPLLADDSRCFLTCGVSRSSADYIDTANTLRIATRFARIVNACTKRVLSIDPRQFSFTPLDAVLSFQERADPLSVRSPHRSPLGEGFGDNSAEVGDFVDPILQGSALRMPKSPIQSFRQVSPAITDNKPQAKSKSTAEVIHLTLSQVENIEQVANEIMETTKQVDRAIRDSPAPDPRGRRGGESGANTKTVSEKESSGGEGSFYSSVLSTREVSSYQDPILSGAVRFIHSSSSSSSSSSTGSGEAGASACSGAQDEAEGRGYEHSRGGSYAALNEAARQAALSRLEELRGDRSVQSSSALALPLHSPVTSEETDHSDKGLTEREGATPSPSSSISVASSAKSVETQRKLDNLKQSFRSMSRELELPSAAIEIEVQDEAGAEASSGSEDDGDDDEELGPQGPEGRGRRGSEETEETVVTAGDLASNARLDALAKSTAGDEEEREARKRREAEAAVGRQKAGSGLYEGRYEFEQDLGPESGPDAFIQERDGVSGSSPRPSQRDYADLERAYDSLLKMLEREREAYVSSQQKLKLVERDLLESQHTLSAQLDGQKLENVHLRSRCRQLEELIGYAPAGEGLELSRALPGLDPGSEASGKRSGGGLLGEIFEQLETEVDRLNEENALLREDLQSAHLSHAETVAIVHRKIEDLSQAAAGDDEDEEGGRNGDGDGDDDDGSHGGSTMLDQDTKDVLRAYRREQRDLLSRHQRNKLQALTKRMKKVEEELREARSEVASYRKKDRKYAIHKRGVEETIRRCGLLQKELEHKDQELVRSQLKFAEAEGKCYTLSQDHAKMAASVQKMQEKLEHSETVKRKYAEQLGWARKQVTREAVLSKLPQLPSGSSEIDSHRLNSLATRKVQSTASEICRRIRREPGLSPRVENMLDRLMQETALHVQERAVLARREALLLQMITGDQFQGLVGGRR